eukprot:TRINITY_DN2708_c0_g1_i1.p1 TRINITY_DN2708_c0_g1~~TRINITY_DN2708_c0_g1_i1.p1  ORF type:complete len:542 (-),score=107.83 TRINITY_DN2708_c0_g1_i1:937-2562(-)
MPELAEVHRYCNTINSTQDRVYDEIRVLSNCKGSPTMPDYKRFTIRADVRGKELALHLQCQSSDDSTSLCFNHGLVGKWIVAAKGEEPQGTRLLFASSNDSACLCLVDVQKMASWRVGTWGADRGPDPIDDFENFEQNVKNHVHLADFKKPVCELMLNQKYFNGIGNYLRAEVLHRAGVSPFARGAEVFTSPAGERVLRLCHDVPCEVLSLDLNKYGTPEELSKFEAWLQIYSKGECKRDSNGRKIYFSPSQGNSVVPLSQPEQPAKSYTKSPMKQPTIPDLWPQSAVPQHAPAAAPPVAAPHASASPFWATAEWQQQLRAQPSHALVNDDAIALESERSPINAAAIASIVAVFNVTGDVDELIDSFSRIHTPTGAGYPSTADGPFGAATSAVRTATRAAVRNRFVAARTTGAGPTSGGLGTTAASVKQSSGSFGVSLPSAATDMPHDYECLLSTFTGEEALQMVKAKIAAAPAAAASILALSAVLNDPDELLDCFRRIRVTGDALLPSFEVKQSMPLLKPVSISTASVRFFPNLTFHPLC